MYVSAKTSREVLIYVFRNTKTYTKSKDELFYYLHNTSKIKEMRLNKMIEEEYAKFQQINKKGTKAEFE